MLLRLRYITGQWHNQPKNWGGKMFDFRRITLYCLEKRFSFHKMTVCSKNLEGRAPLVGLSYAYVTGHGPVGRFLVSSGRAGLQQCWSVRSLDVGGKRIFYKKFACTRIEVSKTRWPVEAARSAGDAGLHKWKWKLFPVWMLFKRQVRAVIVKRNLFFETSSLCCGGLCECRCWFD